MLGLHHLSRHLFRPLASLPPSMGVPPHPYASLPSLGLPIPRTLPLLVLPSPYASLASFGLPLSLELLLSRSSPLYIGFSPLPLVISLDLPPLPLVLSLGLSPLPLVISLGLSPLPLVLSLGLSPLPLVLSLGHSLSLSHRCLSLRVIRLNQ